MKKITKKSTSHRLIFKIITISVIVLGFVSMIVGLSIDWKKPKWIFIAGSSTMQPLLNDISKVYKSAEISANSGGSSYGIKSVLENKKNIGAVSKMPSQSDTGLGLNTTLTIEQQKWKDFGIKTVTIGKDAIGVVYKDSANLTINNNNIVDFYKIFCGYEQIKISTLNKNASSNKFFVPFARSGGANESGTAEAFLVDNNLDNGNKNSLQNQNINNQSVWNILKNGKYGKYTQQTNESNLETWETIKGYNGPNIPITYLSAGFIKNNYNEIKEAGFKVAQYGDNNVSLIVNNTINENYLWYRPLNLIMRTTKDTVNKKEIFLFIEWLLGNILFQNSDVNKIYDKIGFIAPNASTIKTMFLSNDTIIDNISNYANQNPNNSYKDYLKNNNVDWSGFWASDYIIYETQEQARKNGMYCGAIFK